VKVKFRIQDTSTGKIHKLCVKGNTKDEMEQTLAARLILMGIPMPRFDQIQAKVIKK